MGVLITLGAFAPTTVRSAPGAGAKRIVVVRSAFQEGDERDNLDEVLAGLAKRGFAEGRELDVRRLTVDFRAIEVSRRSDHVAERVRQEGLPMRPDLFLTEGTGFTEAIRRATRTVPIVTSVADPVGSGFATSLARPGGNITGLAQGVEETAVKTVEIVRRLVPRLTRIAVFHGPGRNQTRFAGHYERAARTAGIEPLLFPVSDETALVAAIRRAASRPAQAGLLAASDGFGSRAVRTAIEVRLPIVGFDEYLTEGGLLASYNASDPDRWERLAALTEKILRGGDPATIPFQYPLTYRLVLNRRTAKALGLEIPSDLLLRADRVIE